MRHRLLRFGHAISCVVLLMLAADSASAQRGQRSRDDGAPKVGDKAPLFKLKTLEGNEVVDLAEVIKTKPVVLFFGSYT